MWYSPRVGLPILVCFMLALPAGCQSTPVPVVSAPSYDVDKILSQLMAKYDTNQDGELDSGELGSCPALKSAMNLIDTNQDGVISKTELENRIRLYSTNSIVGITCEVMVSGMPAKGCKIKLTPDAAFANLKPATGVTVENGTINLKIEGETSFGVMAGLYTVEILDESGTLLTKTRTGREVCNDPANPQQGLFRFIY